MEKIRRIRLFGMISIIILLLVYLYLRTLPEADVPFLQLSFMLVGGGITLASMIVIYILDKQNRKNTLIGIVLIIVVVVAALFIR